MDMKELLELYELSNEANKKKVDKERPEIVKRAKEASEEFERCLLIVSDKTCQIYGTGINLLGAISLLVNKVHNNCGIPKDIIMDAVKIGLKDDEDEPQKENKEMLNSLKTMLEAMKEMLGE